MTQQHSENKHKTDYRKRKNKKKYWINRDFYKKVIDNKIVGEQALRRFKSGEEY